MFAACLSAADDLDVITLETCQSTVAMALGMVMAGTGEVTNQDIASS